MNYKLFLPAGASESSNTVTLASGLSFPKYAFIAVPIIGLQGGGVSDLLSTTQTNPVYYDTLTNSFTLSKKIRNIASTSSGSKISSLSTSDADALIKSNFDGYVNISTLITNVKNAVADIQSTSTALSAYEQDIGYTSVRVPNMIDYTITVIDPIDDYTNLDYELSQNLTLRDLLVYKLKPQTLNSQLGLSKKIIVSNLKNLAVNIFEPVLYYLLDNQISNIQILSAFTENVYFVPDQEFYIGEAIQLSFPGSTSASVYLFAKEILNMLYFNEMYLDYFLEDEPKITIILNGSSQQLIFGTRFEYNLIHPNRLVNIDKSFDPNSVEDTVQSDGSLSSSISIRPVNINRDKTVLTNFIKDALSAGYLQSQNSAITFAYSANLDISSLSSNYISDSSVAANTTLNIIKNSSGSSVFYDEPADYSVDYDASGTSSDDLNTAISLLLPSLIKCPTITNGSVNGTPRQDIFPMMSYPTFKSITDLSLLNNPTNNSGEYGIPQSVRFNNPFLVSVVEGVTNKIEDGFIGAVGGKAVYSNRIGGLVAGLRQMQSQNTSGKTLFDAASSMVPKGLLAKLTALLSEAFFNINDPTGSLLSCAQFDFDGNVNDQIVMIGSMLASFTGQRISPITFEEIATALQHVKGDSSQVSKNIDGTLIGTTRTPATELTSSVTKLENTAGTLIKDIANTLLNGVEKLIVTGFGQDIETKSLRITSDSADTYQKYDIGSDHADRLAQLGSSIISTAKGKKDSII